MCLIVKSQSSPPQGKLGQGRVSQFPESTSWVVEGFAYKKVVLVPIVYMECSISCTDRTCRVRSLQSETKIDWNEMIKAKERRIPRTWKRSCCLWGQARAASGVATKSPFIPSVWILEVWLGNNASSMVPGFSSHKMLLKSNLSLAIRSYTKMETEPEKECSTGGWWRWPWPPCPAPPLFALWVRPISSPSWQSERGSAQPQGLPIVSGCQFMIQYKLQHMGSGNTVGLWNCWVENFPQSQNLFLVVSLVLTNIAWVWIWLVSRGPIVEAGTQCCFTFSSVTGISLNQLLPSAGMSHNVCWDSYRTQRQEPAVVFSNYG